MSHSRTSRPFLSFVVVAIVAIVVGSAFPATAAASSRSLSIKASTTVPTVGSSVTVSGVLSRSPKGATVTVQRLSGSRWVTARSARTTSTRGAYSAKVTVPSTAGTLTLRAVSKAIKNRKAATSRTMSLDVRRKVTITAVFTPTRTTLGSTVTLSGTVAPFVPGSAVTIQQVSGTKAATVTTTSVRPDGSYGAALKPTKTGSHTFRAVVAGRTGHATATSPSRTVAVDPAPVQPVISTSSLATATVGKAYTARLATSGNQPGTWRVSPSMPSGLTLDAVTGTIAGTPTQVGSDALTFTFTHANGNTAQKLLTLEVAAAPVVVPAPVVSTSSLPVTSRGATYSLQLAASESGTWSIGSGALPSGLSLSSTGRISGTVKAQAGSSAAVEVVVKGSTSGKSSDPRQLTIDVLEQVATKALPTGAAQEPYSYQMRTNGTIAGTWRTLGGAPSGMTLSASGVLSGTPTQSGTLFYEFVPADPSVQERQQPLDFTVEAPMTTTPSTTRLSAGNQLGCRVLSTDGTLWCWGYDFKGDLGIGNGSLQNVVFPTPQQVGRDTTWRGVSAGSFASTCATRTDDSLWCWGYNSDGQLGDGSTTDANTPRRVAAGRAWASVSVADFHACAIARAGSLWCWGSKGVNNLGGAVPEGSSVPALVDGGVWTSVSAGSGISCATKSDGTLWCWGVEAGAVPTQVGTGTWSSVETGFGTACGVRTDDSLWCWGNNRGGQVGDGTTTNRAAPVRVGAERGWRSVATGGANSSQSTCAVATDGSAWCWGTGTEGQLGDGTSRSSLVPVRVDATSSWSSLTVGNDAACGVKNDGTQRCWGAGSSGQLGQGSRASSSVPVVVR